MEKLEMKKVVVSLILVIALAGAVNASTGKLLVRSYNGSDWDLYVMDEDGNNLMPIDISPADTQYGDFSPDGQTILYERTGESKLDFCQIPISGGTPKVVAVSITNIDAGIRWGDTPDHFFYNVQIGGSCGSRDMEIHKRTYTLDPAGFLDELLSEEIIPSGKIVDLWDIREDLNKMVCTDVIPQACWSPYTVLVTYDADGTNRHVLPPTNDGKGESYPTISPDGEYILFYKSDSASGWQNPCNIYRIRWDGTEQEPLTNYVGDYYATHPVSRDNDSLFYSLATGNSRNDVLHYYTISTGQDVVVPCSLPNCQPLDFMTVSDASGLVAYYPFDGDANDASGNGNDGVVNGASLCEDRCGEPNRAYCFDGMDDYVDIGAPSSLRITGALTVAAWFYAKPAALSDPPSIVSRYGWDTNRHWCWGLRLNDGMPQGWISQTGNSFKAATGENVVDSNIWHHLAMTYKPSEFIKLYLDGSLVAENTTSIPVSINNPEGVAIYVGAAWIEEGYIPPGHPFTGRIDEVRIYNRALSACEIEELAGECPPPCRASFQGLGDLSGGSFLSYGWAVSPDGSVVVGQSSSSSGTEAFRWTSVIGMEGLGAATSVAQGCSTDGSTIVGHSNMEARFWRQPSGIQLLDGAEARDVSADGSIIVGRRSGVGVRWREDNSWIAESIGGCDAAGISTDGTVIVGRTTGSTDSQAFYWTESGGLVVLGDLLGGGYYSVAYAVSADGKVVVGHSKSASGYDAFRWEDLNNDGNSDPGEMQGLGAETYYAYGASADGSVVVGRTDSVQAFIWDECNGMRNLKNVLESDYGLDLTGWVLKRAYGISDDGLTIVGWGMNPDGRNEAWIVKLCEPLCIPPCWQEQAKLTADDGEAGDGFGQALDLSGATAIVGALHSDDAGSLSGSAYLYDFTDPCNIKEIKLMASDAAANDRFGQCVAVSGTIALVGGYLNDDDGTDSGSAYLYDFSDPCNIIETKLTASDAAAVDNFGVSVGVSGTTALVGALWDDDGGTDSGSGYLYDFSDPCNIKEIKLTASDATAGDWLGHGAGLSGTCAIVGAPHDDDAGSMSGSAYIYDFSDPCNIKEIKLTASDAAAADTYGHYVGISGTYAIVGAISDDDDGTDSGSAYLYDFSDPCNIIETKLTASDAAPGDLFGYDVGISGTTAIVGAYYDDDSGTDSGSVYLYDFSDPCNIIETKLTASDVDGGDIFGVAVALSGTTALVGSWKDDDAGTDSGSAYIFENICNTEPIADAGDDQTVGTGPDGEAEVVLDCSDSNDPEGNELTYTWSIDGNEVATGVNPTIVLPCGNYTIELIVNDGTADSEPDYVEITVEDGTPPEITCPNNVTLECPADTDPSATGLATATDNCDDAPTITYGDVAYGACPQLIERTWTATDANGNSSLCVQVITVQDTTPPVFTTTPGDTAVECDGSGNTEELQAWLAGAAASDECGTVTITHNFTALSDGCGATGAATVTWIATDECDNTTPHSATFTIVDTTAPVIESLDGLPLLQVVGLEVQFIASFGDTCGDVTATWDFPGADSFDVTDPMNPTSVYNEPGIYTVTLTITDGCNAVSESLVVVVYDPTAGFTTGGGWFVPDSNSFIDGVGVTDKVSKANFGFIVKYKKGADNPDGNLEFQYRAGDIDLKSSDMEWLVVQSTTKVRFKGKATINGQGPYTFKVTAEDNGEPGTSDWFKIEIWLGVVDTENGPQAPKHKAQGFLGGGNIQIHQK